MQENTDKKKLSIRTPLLAANYYRKRLPHNRWLVKYASNSLRKKCPYSEFFWSKFSRICTEYRDIQNISPYSILKQENTDQENSE